MNWPTLASESHYQTLVAIEHELQQGNVAEATLGLKELLEALTRSAKRALRSQLIRLMLHIIKWKTQPEKQTRSSMASIYNAREEIHDLQQETPSLTDTVIRELWAKSFLAAKLAAEGEMNKDASLTTLTWEEVFEKSYTYKRADK